MHSSAEMLRLVEPTQPRSVHKYQLLQFSWQYLNREVNSPSDESKARHDGWGGAGAGGSPASSGGGEFRFSRSLGSRSELTAINQGPAVWFRKWSQQPATQ
jgi:hypothetical protein